MTDVVGFECSNLIEGEKVKLPARVTFMKDGEKVIVAVGLGSGSPVRLNLHMPIATAPKIIREIVAGKKKQGSVLWSFTFEGEELR